MIPLGRQREYVAVKGGGMIPLRRQREYVAVNGGGMIFLRRQRFISGGMTWQNQPLPY